MSMGSVARTENPVRVNLRRVVNTAARAPHVRLNLRLAYFYRDIRGVLRQRRFLSVLGFLDLGYRDVLAHGMLSFMFWLVLALYYLLPVGWFLLFSLHLLPHHRYGTGGCPPPNFS
jgi:hypothetical protein